MILEIDCRLGGYPRYRLLKKRRPFMQVRDEIRKCVAFVSYFNHDNQAYTPVGTVFFVAVPGETVSDALFVYAVTARHTIDELSKRGVDKTYLRLNLNAGGVDHIEVAIGDWIFHSDDSVDVAIIHFPLNHVFDAEPINIKDAVTPQTITDEAIGIGDEVFLVGLFSNHYGKTRNVPIVRVGNIAAMPEEPVYTRRGNAEAYLVECRSIAGLSGSPVFVNVRGLRGDKGKDDWVRWGKTVWWIGLMQGHFPRRADDETDIVKDQVEDADGAVKKETIHTGISIVVPVAKILHLLNRPEVVQVRRDREKQIMNSNAPIMD